MTPSFKGNPLILGHKILSQKTRVLVVADSEDFLILACTILIQIKTVTYGQTDRHLNDG